ncbi:MAG: hypothetical protein ACR2PR_02505 [Pseudohongiellaceae bacterium]
MRTFADDLKDEGAVQGKVEILKRLVKKKFGSLSWDIEHKIDDALHSPEVIDGWLDAILATKSIKDMFTEQPSSSRDKERKRDILQSLANEMETIGRTSGLIKCMAKENVEILRWQVDRKFGSKKLKIIEKQIDQALPGEIDGWLDKIVTDQSFDDVFAQQLTVEERQQHREKEEVPSYRDTFNDEQIAKGEAMGVIKAMTEGKAATLKRQVELRFGPVPDTIKEEIDQASPEKIFVLLNMIPAAQKFENLFPNFSDPEALVRAVKADKNWEEIWRRGWEDGIKVGKIMGQTRAKMESLTVLLALKFEYVPDGFGSRIRDATLEELDEWIGLVPTAETLKDVFGSEDPFAIYNQ